MVPTTSTTFVVIGLGKLTACTLAWYSSERDSRLIGTGGQHAGDSAAGDAI
ncbi:hypothetical protein PF008_g16224 [Phytophthora fragariae]|uniref:Uncharacterized protein n=1 Tax=Phytophthora fragariae TaxID=53985 RepID=A0A6G0RCY9_9STRA|nr:hypothetical protein PF008_g16224 [Phytophthora fragariae]